MSVEALRWAFAQHIIGPSKAVLLALAYCHNKKTERCDPSAETLSRLSGVSVRHVRRVLAELETSGKLERSISQGRKSNQYKLAVQPGQSDKVEEIEPGQSDRVEEFQPGHTDRQPGQGVTQTMKKGKNNNYCASQNAQMRFDDFWQAYPKKRDKKRSRDIWNRKKLDQHAAQIIQDVAARTHCDQHWRDGYIPNPSTYLNGERWEDEIIPRGQKSGGNGKRKFVY